MVDEGRRFRREYADDRREHRVSLRLNAAEFEVVERAADLACLKPASYAARAVLAIAENTTPPATGSAVQLQTLGRELLQLTVQLKRVGGNLNQAVAQFHVTGEPPSVLHETLIEVRAVTARVEEATSLLYRLVRGGSEK